jgi:hypothetical protein
MRYYTIFDCGHGLVAGEEITGSHGIYMNTASSEYSKRAREMLTLSDAELKKRRKISAEKEKGIYAKLNPILEEWEEQAANTTLLDKVIYYCEAEPRGHTNNMWKVDGTVHSIINTVYAMIYNIHEMDGKFYPSWGVYTNAPLLDPMDSRVKEIAVVNTAQFTNRIDAEKYIKKCFKKYAHLFKELNPPVPLKYKDIFEVNGILLKGYRLESGETREKEVTMKYYHAYDLHDGLVTGEKINTGRRICVDTDSPEYLKQARELLRFSYAELEEQYKISVEKEKSICAKLNPILKEWEEQAANTALTNNIIQYNAIKPSEHTGNKWRQNEYGQYEISNRVYRMFYNVRDCGDKHYLSWYIDTNAPLTGSYNKNRTVTKQECKRFKDKASMEKYMEGRKKAYAHLFTEINPPVSEDYAWIFKNNDLPLKGYRLEETQEREKAAA